MSYESSRWSGIMTASAELVNRSRWFRNESTPVTLGKGVSTDDPGPRCPLDEVLPPNPNELALRLLIAGTCELPVRGVF